VSYPAPTVKSLARQILSSEAGQRGKERLSGIPFPAGLSFRAIPPPPNRVQKVAHRFRRRERFAAALSDPVRVALNVAGLLGAVLLTIESNAQLSSNRLYSSQVMHLNVQAVYTSLIELRPRGSSYSSCSARWKTSLGE
jgi:hypothetical protein